MVVQLRHHDMAPLDQPHRRGRVRPHHRVGHLRGPTVRPALTSARARSRRRAPVCVSRSSSSHTAPSRCADTHSVRVATAAPRSAASRAFSTVSRESSTQQSEYSNPESIVGLQRRPGRVPPQLHRARGRQLPAPAQMVVEEQPEPQQPRRPQLGVIRQYETQRPDDVRRDAPQHLALLQGLAHQPELVVLEVAQPAMDQLGGRRRRAGAEILALAQEDAPPPPGGIPRDPAAINAATDDRDVVDLVRRLTHALPLPPFGSGSCLASASPL